MSILIFFGVLFLLILVHEWGHFIVAKKTGMRVDEFGIGFPPRLFGVKKGETEYTFNALPIGGFVRIYGENAADAAEDAAAGSSVAGSFTSKSKWAQAAVLVAGVVMNILLAWALLATAFMVGVPTQVAEEEAGSAAVLTIQGVLDDAPAAAAGLPLGSTIVSIADESTELTTPLPSEFSAFIAERGGQELTVTYSQNDVSKVTTIVPTTDVVPDKPDQAAIGVSLALVETERLGFFAALGKASADTVRLLGAITVGLASLIVDTFTGTADYSQIAGPVGIVGLVGDAAAIGIVTLMMFTAVISLNLAVINLLPFPALDGGRLLLVAIEAVLRRPINPVWVARLNGVGFLLLLLLMVAVTYNDIAKLL